MRTKKPICNLSDRLAYQFGENLLPQISIQGIKNASAILAESHIGLPDVPYLVIDIRVSDFTRVVLVRWIVIIDLDAVGRNSYYARHC